ncbi:hypothetical protein [Bradyrhizobium mercantei]|uniref:hypothetical protein n=1 Tax=Bradyrhizobium mercantei TaxID=1904807 RepID=UPI0011777546|nr:hypothetical protein [Bradyrhizobium mercantei]
MSHPKRQVKHRRVTLQVTHVASREGKYGEDAGNNLPKKVMMRIPTKSILFFLAKELAPVICILKWSRVFSPHCPPEGLSATGARPLFEVEE